MMTLWHAVMTWAASSGIRDIAKLPECHERPIMLAGKPALVSINGHSERGAKARDGFEVPPFHVYININGWPALLCSPREGTIMGSDPKAEAELIAAFESAALSQGTEAEPHG